MLLTQKKHLRKKLKEVTDLTEYLSITTKKTYAERKTCYLSGIIIRHSNGIIL